MPSESASQTVIVTGGSRGIGFAIAEKFAAAGHRILLCARNNERLAEAAVKLAKAYPPAEVFFYAADLSEKNAVQEFAHWSSQYGAPSVLVNNAGAYRPGDILTEPDENLEMLMNGNLFSAYYLTRAVLPAMIEAGKGHIFNIASIAALAAYDGGGSYSISKFALHGFSKNLRQELRSTGIKVTSVLPGAVMTDTWAGFDNSSSRIMLPSDVAEMIFAATLLSAQAVVEEIVMRPQLGDL